MKFEEVKEFIKPNLKQYKRRAGLREVKFMYDLIVMNGLKGGVEIGCCRGFSTLFLSAALQETGSILTVVEINPKHAEHAANLCKELEFETEFVVGDSKKILSTDMLQKTNYQFAFIDGNHSVSYAKSEYEQLSKHMKPVGVVCFHDVDPHSGKDSVKEVTRYVNKIGGHFAYVDHMRCVGVKWPQGYPNNKDPQREVW